MSDGRRDKEYLDLLKQPLTGDNEWAMLLDVTGKYRQGYSRKEAARILKVGVAVIDVYMERARLLPHLLSKDWGKGTLSRQP